MYGRCIPAKSGQGHWLFLDISILNYKSTVWDFGDREIKLIIVTQRLNFVRDIMRRRK
jgi:hypothetical protein